MTLLHIHGKSQNMVMHVILDDLAFYVSKNSKTKNDVCPNLLSYEKMFVMAF